MIDDTVPVTDMICIPQKPNDRYYHFHENKSLRYSFKYKSPFIIIVHHSHLASLITTFPVLGDNRIGEQRRNENDGVAGLHTKILAFVRYKISLIKGSTLIDARTVLSTIP